MPSATIAGDVPPAQPDKSFFSADGAKRRPTPRSIGDQLAHLLSAGCICPQCSNIAQIS